MYFPVSFAKEDNPQDVIYSYTPSDARKMKKNVYILTNTPYVIKQQFISQTDGLIEKLDDLDDKEISDSFFYIYFPRGDDSLLHLKRIIECGGMFCSPNLYGKIPHWQNNKYCIDIYNEMCFRLAGQPKGSIAEFASIMQAIDATKDLEGDYVEIGVFSGSSALAALLYMRDINIKRACWFLDTYGGFNYEAAKNSTDQKWFGTHTSVGGLTGNALKNRIIKLTEGLQPEIHVEEFNAATDELPSGIVNIAMANLDVDMYEPTKSALQLLASRLVKNGIITTEDPTSTMGLYGAYYALYEFLESKEGSHFTALRSETTYFLIKNK